MSRGRVTSVVRAASAAAVLAAIVWRVGAGPFVDGLRAIDVTIVASAVLIGAITTVACAWRWQTIAGVLGAPISFRAAIAACYRSVFLNTMLPLGVVGDVHRAVRHGRGSGEMARGARSVAWERGVGQAVQVVLTVVVLLLLPSPVRGWIPVVAAVIVACGVGAVVVARSRSTRPIRGTETLRRDVRAVLAGRTWPVVVAASAVVVVAQGFAVVLAARAAGSQTAALTLVPIALLVLMAMAVPMSLAGWGPREGAAAWAFGAAGLGAATGVTAAVVYGVMSLLAALPGAALLLMEARHA